MKKLWCLLLALLLAAALTAAAAELTGESEAPASVPDDILLYVDGEDTVPVKPDMQSDGEVLVIALVQQEKPFWIMIPAKKYEALLEESKTAIEVRQEALIVMLKIDAVVLEEATLLTADPMPGLDALLLGVVPDIGAGSLALRSGGYMINCAALSEYAVSSVETMVGGAQE